MNFSPRQADSGIHVKFYHLNSIHPKAVDGAIIRTLFLPKEYEGKPSAWIFEDKGLFTARTNMSQWVTHRIYYGRSINGKDAYRDDKHMEAIDLAHGSFAACEAAIRLYNI